MIVFDLGPAEQAAKVPPVTSTGVIDLAAAQNETVSFVLQLTQMPRSVGKGAVVLRLQPLQATILPEPPRELPTREGSKEPATGPDAATNAPATVPATTQAEGPTTQTSARGKSRRNRPREPSRNRGKARPPARTRPRSKPSNTRPTKSFRCRWT